MAAPPLAAPRPTRPLPPLPISHDHWRRLARSLGLPPREERVVELILRGLKDKEIAQEMGLKYPTIRTYCQRIFLRLQAADRTDLILKLFAASHAAEPTNASRLK